MATKRKSAEIKHKAEFRKITSEVRYCAQPGCKFKGERVVQGVCFHVLDAATDRHLEAVTRRADGFVEELKIAAKGSPLKKRLAYAYDYLAVTWANYEHLLDEAVRLRRQVAILKAAAKKKASR